MSEKMIESLYQKQKITKPETEDIINSSLEDSRMKEALDFVAYIKSSNMKIRWASANSWDVSYKNKGVCKIKIWDHSWSIIPSYGHSKYGDKLFSILAANKMEKIIWNNIYFCRACHKKPCTPISTRIMDKTFDNVCHCVLFQFQDPDTETIECVKKILEYKCGEIGKK